jgi:hypothetical protein
MSGRLVSLLGAPWYSDEFQAWIMNDIAAIGEPVHAVCLSIMRHRVLGGVCVGVPWGIPTLPDFLVGFVDDAGRWHWPGREFGHVVNLHAKDATIAFPPEAVWPVWFTYSEYHGERETYVAPRPPRYLDVSESLRKASAAAFWERAKEEFIRTTWAPSRLAWCLDHEEATEIFSS